MQTYFDSCEFRIRWHPTRLFFFYESNWISDVKKKASHKPGSVIRKANCLSFLYSRHHYRVQSIYPPRSGAQPSSLGLHDLSVRKVYLAYFITKIPVGSYPTLSPFLRIFMQSSLLSVALSVPAKTRPSC